MSAPKLNAKELVFNCKSESEALEILNDYRKKNFHLVSKKNSETESTETVLKLVKFRQSSKANDLETVWENFVKQMSTSGLKNSLIAEVLKRTKAKDNFWETHPEDHFRDIVMDAKNFVKPDGLAKVLVYVAPEADLTSFFCSYQKSITSAISEIGIFVLCPEAMKSSVKELKVSNQVQVMSYASTATINEYKADIDAKIGLILVTPEQLAFIAPDSLIDKNLKRKFSLLQAPGLVSENFFQNQTSFIAGGYDSSSSVFSVIGESLLSETKVAFLWDENSVGTILNPEAQTLKSLDELLGEELSQHSGNK